MLYFAGGNGGLKLPPKIKSPKPKVSLGKSRPQPPVPSISTFPNNSIFGGSVVGNGPSIPPIGFNFANTATFSSAHMLQTLGTGVSRPSTVPTVSTAAGAVKKKPATKRPKKVENGPKDLGGSGPATDVFAFNPNAILPAPVAKRKENLNSLAHYALLLFARSVRPPPVIIQPHFLIFLRSSYAKVPQKVKYSKIDSRRSKIGRGYSWGRQSWNRNSACEEGKETSDQESVPC